MCTKWWVTEEHSQEPQFSSSTDSLFQASIGIGETALFPAHMTALRLSGAVIATTGRRMWQVSFFKFACHTLCNDFSATKMEKWCATQRYLLHLPEYVESKACNNYSSNINTSSTCLHTLEDQRAARPKQSSIPWYEHINRTTY